MELIDKKVAVEHDRQARELRELKYRQRENARDSPAERDLLIHQIEMQQKRMEEERRRTPANFGQGETYYGGVLNKGGM